MKLSLEQQYMLSVLLSQYHTCWCTGNFRSQCISRHSIGLQSRNIPSVASEELRPSFPWGVISTILCHFSMRNFFRCFRHHWFRLLGYHSILSLGSQPTIHPNHLTLSSCLVGANPSPKPMMTPLQAKVVFFTLVATAGTSILVPYHSDRIIEDLVPVDFIYTPGGWFNIKMPSYQYRNSHCGYKTVVRPSYLCNGISNTGKTTSLYRCRLTSIEILIVAIRLL